MMVALVYPSFSLHFLLNIANISISLLFLVFIVMVSLSSIEKKGFNPMYSAQN